MKRTRFSVPQSVVPLAAAALLAASSLACGGESDTASATQGAGGGGAAGRAAGGAAGNAGAAAAGRAGAAGTASAGQAGSASELTCNAQGQKLCEGACKATSSPEVGCGATGCAACPPGNVCSVGACQAPQPPDGPVTAVPPIGSVSPDSTIPRICGTALATTNADFNTCLTSNCCDSFTACGDDENCRKCLTNSGGIKCDTDGKLAAFVKCGTDSCVSGAGGRAGSGGSSGASGSAGASGGAGGAAGGASGAGGATGGAGGAAGATAGAGGTAGGASGASGATGGAGGEAGGAGLGGSAGGAGQSGAGAGGTAGTAGAAGASGGSGAAGAGGGIISCGAGATACGAACVDTKTDEGNCGTCGNTCAVGKSCVDGGCITVCPNERKLCGETCVDVRNDNANCGACGTKCSAEEACVEGECKDLVGPCGQQLVGDRVTDQWGNLWDGKTRDALNFEDADATCIGIGGRLPTADEIYRVSAARTGQVGKASDTPRMWTILPHGAKQTTVSLGDGLVGDAALTDVTSFRCVCPAQSPPGFDGTDCNGPTGASCAEFQSDGRTYAIDKQDRAPLSLSQATWECQFVGGYLPRVDAFARLIGTGKIGAGSNTFLWTGDLSNYDSGTQMRWTGSAAWVPTGSNFRSAGGGENEASTAHPFRCMGIKSPLPAPTGSATTFTHPTLQHAIDTKPTASTNYANAMAACWEGGGHIPTVQELASTIMVGLDNGANESLILADITSVPYHYNFMYWNGGTNERFEMTYPSGMSWSSGDGGYPHRCAYFRVDAAYQGPAEASCNGGCFSTQLGDNGARMWADKVDRPEARWHEAVKACDVAGGHLAPFTEMQELIVAGLPGGTTKPLWTTDSGMEGGFFYVAWSGAPGASHAPFGATNYGNRIVTEKTAYRCVWTNELR